MSGKYKCLQINGQKRNVKFHARGKSSAGLTKNGEELRVLLVCSSFVVLFSSPLHVHL